MSRLYKKSELMFALLWIGLYVILFSAADRFSEMIKVPKGITAIIGILMSVTLLVWIKKNGLSKKYGLCRSDIPASRLLYYVPLAAMASINLWFGIQPDVSLSETMLYIISMLSVGFLEEVLFRGLLFKAMCKDNVKTAIIVSSVTFGIGHLVNLINGSGADLLANLLQVVYAIAGGFLFTMLFYRTNSLLACIITHGILNALSIFADQSVITVGQEILSALALVILSVGYAWYIVRLKKAERYDRE